MLDTLWLFHQSLGAKELSLVQEHRLTCTPSLTWLQFEFTNAYKWRGNRIHCVYQNIDIFWLLLLESVKWTSEHFQILCFYSIIIKHSNSRYIDKRMHAYLGEWCKLDLKNNLLMSLILSLYRQFCLSDVNCSVFDSSYWVV